MVNEDSKASGGIGLPAGTKIGKYEVRERIAVGGQAIVYKCHDPMLDRYVAIKQISSHLAEDPRFMERFRREAQIIARLGSEQQAIVTIHELIEDPRGLFIVMEFVAGNSLETILRQTNGPIEPRATLQILWRLAAGLHAVHSAGIIHRDIKPANIIIADGLRAKITDFGVAASISGQTSMLLGTTKYMAPELFGGQPADARADMYSLGFIAYEMLVGRPKFDEIFADIVRDKHGEALRWMKWHGNAATAAPSAHEVNPQIPHALSDIVAKMMAKDVSHRFESMEALGRAIKASFSPRAKASAQTAAAEEPGRRRRHGRRHGVARSPEGRAPGDDLASADDLVPMDEIELVTVEAPPTVPLPKSRLPLRTKLILSGIVAASIIAVGIIIGVRISQSDQQRLAGAEREYRAAHALYDEGLKTYDPGKLKAAWKGFQAVRDGRRGTEIGRKALVMAPLAEAHVAVLEESWDTAQKASAEATQQLGASKQAGGALAKWADGMAGELDSFVKYMNDAWRFSQELKDAEKALHARKFREARNMLDERLARIELRNPGLRSALSDFQARLAAAELDSGVAEKLADGDGQAERGGFQEALKSYQAAEAMLHASRAALSDERRQQLQEAVAGRKAALEFRQGYQQSLAAAEAAAQGGDKAAELAALGAAAKSLEGLTKALKPDDLAALEGGGKVLSASQIQQRIAGLKAELALAEGRGHLQAGRIDDAIQSFQESLALKKTPEAADALDQARKGRQFAALVEQAQAAEAAGQFDEAIKKYAEAAALKGDDETIKAKAEELRYRKAMAEADKLREQKKYPEAAAAYEQARQIKPASAADIDARLGAMKQQQDYETLLATGDKAMKERSWSAALTAFTQAKASQDTDEVRQRISLVRYSENLALGKAALTSKEYKVARGYFKVAQGFMDTPEVRQLIDETDKQTKD